MKSKDECQRPFSPCWCESRPKNPHCNDVENLPIENHLLSITIVFFIAIVVFRKFFK